MVAMVVSACGAVHHAPRPARPTTLAASAARIRASAPPIPPALAELRGALAASLRAAGPQSGALVYDLSAKEQLFAARAGVTRPPASVEKLYTTLALLTRLSPNARLQTTVLGSGDLGPGGVWNGDLYLQGGGDPTLGDGTFNQIWNEGYGPTALELVQQLAGDGIHAVTGHVFGDDTLFDARRGGPSTGYAPDVPDFGGQLAGLTYDHGAATGSLSPGAFAARQLARTLRADHIHALASPLTVSTPAGARPLASVQSPPLSVLLRLMDVHSDDFFAEMLTKQLGTRFGAGGSIGAGAGVIATTIGLFGVDPTIVDGSGLSRADRSSPRQVVELLSSVWGTWMGRALEHSLPTVGVNGTVQRIGTGTPAQGRCVAKTGTLDFVTNLAGYCSARGGHTLAFALLLDGPSNDTATKLLSRMVGAIARY